MDLETIGALLGHKTLGMTSRYAHLSDDYKLRAVGCLDNILTKAQNQAQMPYRSRVKTMSLSQFFVK